MHALLLAAGFGTRLGPITRQLPKCLVPINGRPLLEYWFENLGGTAIRSILVNLHHMADVVGSFLEFNSDASVVSTVYESRLLGTGGTLLANRSFFRGEPVMMVHADNLCHCDFHEFIERHHQRPVGTEITMMTFETTTPESCGIVKIDDRGIVREFYEKVDNPPGNLANGAVYIVEPSVIDFLSKLNKDVIDFSTEVLPHYIGKINTFFNNKFLQDIGNIENYLSAQLNFPYTIAPPEGNDYWTASFCRRPEVVLRFSSALAEAKDTSIQTYEFFSKQSNFNDMQPSLSNDRTGFVLWDKIPNQFFRKLEALKKYLDVWDLTHVFKFVPAGFSARKLYNELGIKSLAICARQ